MTRNFPPLTGGMERLVKNIYDVLKTEYDVQVLGPNGCEAYLEPSAQVHTCKISPVPFYLICNFLQAIVCTLRNRPVIIFGGSGLVAPAVLIASKFGKAKSICYLHGLDIIADSILYRMLFLPAIRSLNVVIVNSRNTAALAEKIGIQSSKIRILHPPATVLSQSKSLTKKDLALEIGENDKILLSVGRQTERKGIKEFIENAMPELVAIYPDLRLVIIGASASDAIRPSVNQTERITEIVEVLNLQKNVVMLGKVDDEVLSAAYKYSNLHVFPLLPFKNDVEGFGIVAIEAATYGLPTVAFNVGGVADAVLENKSGYLVTSGDYDTMIDKVSKIIDHQSAITAESCTEFASQFSQKIFSRKLLDLCSESLDD